jgi:hypothetical protein
MIALRSTIAKPRGHAIQHPAVEAMTEYEQFLVEASGQLASSSGALRDCLTETALNGRHKSRIGSKVSTRNIGPVIRVADTD